MRIRERLQNSIHSHYSYARTGVDYAAKPRIKRTSIDANKPDVLNPIDYKYIKEDEQLAEEFKKPEEKPIITADDKKIPKIDCHEMISLFHI